jgi:hypothetical protein
MRIDRSLLNWGVFLVALGGIPLAVDQGWLGSDIARDLGRLWPLILVGIGLGLILRWTRMAWFGGALVAATFGVIFGAAAVAIRNDDFASIQGIIPAIATGGCAGVQIGGDTTTQDGLATTDTFDLDLTLSCGELEVSRSGGAAWSLVARHGPDEAPQVETTDRDGAVAAVRLAQDGTEDFIFLGRPSRSAWDVQVPAEAAVRVGATFNAASGVVDTGAGPVSRLSATLNASDVDFDLSAATTPEPASLDLTLNAGDSRLTLPDGDLGGSITLNASSLVVCVPAEAALRVEISSVLGSDDLGRSGLDDEGSGRWATADYATATERVSLSITSTVSSVSLERPEACS